MGERLGVSIDDPKPPCLEPFAGAQPLVLLACLPHQVGVDALQEGMHLRPVEPAVVIHPPRHDRVDRSGSSFKSCLVRVWICHLRIRWPISLRRARWWCQRERAWWRRRQSSQCAAWPGGQGRSSKPASRRRISGTVSGIMPRPAGGGWRGVAGRAWLAAPPGCRCGSDAHRVDMLGYRIVHRQAY